MSVQKSWSLLNWVFLWTIPLIISNAFPADIRERDAKLKFFIGDVNIRSKDPTSKWIPAKVGMKLKTGNMIRTRVESSAEVILEEGSTIMIEENSVFQITALEENRRNKSKSTKLDLMTGKILANVKKLGSTRSDFEFETPVATAAIRGTKLSIDFVNGQTSVKLYEGQVFVFPKGNKTAGITINPDQMVQVTKEAKKLLAQVLVEKQEKSKETPPAPKVDTTGVRPDTTKAPAPTDTSGMKKSELSPADTVKTKTAEPVPAPVQPEDNIKEKEEELYLTLDKPGDGDRLANPTIMVSGIVNDGADVSVNGVKATVSGGQYSAMVSLKRGSNTIIVAATFRGQSKSMSVDIFHQPNIPFKFAVSSPQDGQEISDKPQVIVAYTLTPDDAQVKVNGIPVTSGSALPIMNETGDYTFEICATFNEETRCETRTIHYTKPKCPWSLQVVSPKSGEVIRLSDFPVVIQLAVTGDCKIPFDVRVNGIPAVGSGNQFSLNYKFGEGTLGDQALSVVASDGEEEQELSVDVRVDATSPLINTSLPKVAADITDIRTTRIDMKISITDATPDDVLKLTVEIDGTKEETDGLTNGAKETIDLPEGKHIYRIYAQDMAGNRSATIVKELTSIPPTKRPVIKLLTPATTYLKRPRPPNPPGIDDVYEQDLEFVIENVVDDNPEFIRNVTITIQNSRLGTQSSVQNAPFSDLDFLSNIGVSPGTNFITIKIIDIANNEVTTSLTIDIPN